MGRSGSGTILLVEDYKDSREMTKLLLEGAGYRILEARNGREALDFASNETLDLVLTDFNLPDIDGTTFIKRLRELGGKMMQIPVIMATAHDRANLYDLAMAAGCTAFFTKPVDLMQLEEVINTLLQESRELNRPVNGMSR